MIILLFNIILAFIIPWIFVVWLFFINPKIILIIFSFTSVVSHTINAIGINMNFWAVKPFELKAFSALPFDLGYFPLLGCFLVYIISKTKRNPYSTIFIFVFLITCIEFLGVLSEFIIYGNGWNIFYTYFSYLIAYTLVYWYYLWLKKLNIF